MSRTSLASLIADPQTNPMVRESLRRQLAEQAPRQPSMKELALPKQPSTLEEQFGELWKQLDGPTLEREVEFCSRKFKFDFLHRETMVAVEIDGASNRGSKGGHTSKKGYPAGCEKGNLAILLGYRMFRLTATMIVARHVQPIVAMCRKG